MNVTDKICKSSKLTIDYVNDVVEAGLLRAGQEMNLSEGQMRHILQASKQSFEEGYQRSFDSFRRSVDSAVAGK
jgi:hypothetical protein